MRKKLVYTTDNNRKYLVSLDEELGNIGSAGGVGLFGFRPATDAESKELDSLPRGIKMRNYGCNVKTPSANKKSYRTFAVGSPSASILANSVDFSYKGVMYTPRRFHPERHRK